MERSNNKPIQLPNRQAFFDYARQQQFAHSETTDPQIISIYDYFEYRDDATRFVVVTSKHNLYLYAPWRNDRERHCVAICHLETADSNKEES